MKLEINADADTGLYDIEEVTAQVEAKVESLAGVVSGASDGSIGSDVALTEETLAFATQFLADKETAAQNQVDALKAKDAATVNLQQKVEEYNSTAKAINVNNVEFGAARATLGINNGGVSVSKSEGYNNADNFKVTVDVDGGRVELSFDKNGELVVEGFSANLGEVQDARVALDAAKEAAVAPAEALADANSELAQAQTELTEAEAAAATAADALTTADAELADAQTELTDAEAAAATAAAALDAADAALADAQTELDAATAVNEAIKGLDAGDIDDDNAASILAALADVEGDSLGALKEALEAPDAAPDYTDANAALEAAKTEANNAVSAAQADFDATTTAQEDAEQADADAKQAVIDAQADVDAKTTAQEDAEQADADAKQAVIDAQADVDAKTTAQAAAAQADTDAKKAVTDAQAALDALLTSSDDIEDVFNNLDGVEDFIASVEALYGNIAAQAAAAAAVDAAILNSLKKAGYKVYEEGQDKAVAWTNVKVDNGTLVNADKDTDKTFVLKALDSKDVEKEDHDEIKVGDALVGLPQINAEDGSIAANANSSLPDMPVAIQESAAKSALAVEALEDAQQSIEDFNKAVDEYNAAVEAQGELKDAAADVKATAEAVTEAEEAFDDLGFNLVKAEDGVADGTAFDENAEDQAADLFVYGESKLTVENFDGNDVLYFGDKAADLITITKAQAESAAGKVGGEDNVLDIFAYQDGANTILLVEKEAFAGNASGAATDNPDLVEVTLTGVNVADLSFEDGFLALA